MTKAINDEDRKAQVGKYLRAEHFTGGIVSLYLVKVSQEERESKNTGKMYSQNVYEFLDKDREDKIFTSFLDDAFWKAFEKADPEIGQLMDISAEEVAQNVYLWTIELGKEIIDIYDAAQFEEDNGQGDASDLAGTQVIDEDTITLDDLPDVLK